MSEQSQRNEMNAAIRAQRERQNVPRSIAPEPLAAPPQRPAQPTPAPEPERPKGLLSRLLRR